MADCRGAAPAPAPAPAAARVTAGNCPGNPNALGISRVVEIDTTGGPGFGFEQFKSYDFLKEGEIVLTFDDGPWPGNTPAVLAALDAQCVKATFFPIGKHTIWHPEILKQVALRPHRRLAHLVARRPRKKTPDEQKEEIEKGFSAVRRRGRRWRRPFFRFPGLQQSAGGRRLFGERNIGIFSTDFDSFDFKPRSRRRGRLGDDQAQEARQGHRADARLPARHRRGLPSCWTSSRPAATRSSISPPATR